MKLQTFILCGVVAMALHEPLAIDRAQAASDEAPATICGTVISWAGHKYPNVEVYLFNDKQAVPLRRLLQDTSSRLRSIGSESLETDPLIEAFYEKVVKLVPRLERVARERSDKEGAYRFSNVAPNGRYYVVALAVTEDGVFYAAKKTPTPKPGEQLRIEVREVYLWNPQ